MVLSIFILFYFFLKFVIAKNLNETNFIYQYQNTNDTNRLVQCLNNLILNSSNITNKEKKENIICILEETRDNPKVFNYSVIIMKVFIAPKLKQLLNNTDIEFLYDLLNDIFRNNCTFFDDLFDVIEKNPELVNYTIILVKGEIDGKNITQGQTLNIIYNILNIEGIDKVFNHIVNSTQNGELLILFEKFLNGTKYAKLYENLKDDIIYPNKDKIIQLIYNILKSGLLISEDESKDKEKIVYILEMIKDFINSIKPNIRKNLKKYLDKHNITFLYNLTNEIYSDNSTFINDLFYVLENNIELINYTLILLAENIEIKNFSLDELFKFLSDILNIDGMDKVISHLINSTYNEAIIQLIEIIIFNGTNYFKLFSYFKPILIKYKTPIIQFGYQFLKTYNDKDALIKTIKNFITEKRNNELIKEFCEKFMDENVRKEFITNIIFGKESENIIKEEVLASEETIKGFFDIIKNEKILEIIIGFLVQSQNIAYIEENMFKIFQILYDENEIQLNFFFDICKKILLRILLAESTSLYFAEKLMEKFFNLYIKQNNTNESTECSLTMRELFFNKINISNIQVKNTLIQMRYFFLKKIIIDTTKNKNDFLTFENCLDEVSFDNVSLEKLNFNVTLKPIYLLSMIDDNVSKANLTDSIFNEQYNYWIGFCFPYPQKNDSTEICSKEEYHQMSKFILQIGFNMTNATIDSFSISKKDFEIKDKLYCAMNFIILFIPIIIQIILYAYYSITYLRYKQRHIFNQLTINQEEEMQKNKYLSYQKQKNINIKKDKIIFPKWYKYLNEYFNLVKNGAELFNNNSKESNVNNINGITYIKGLLGISMLLFIFGHLYLILFNFPFKNLAPNDFISFVKNPLFCIPFIGLRYSPRIILSCSGYTLIYKFLNFIDQKQKYYLLKFIFRQSYKYLLLIMVVLYMRYSVYYLNMILSDNKRPMMEILKHNLENDNNKSNYFRDFFTFLLAYIGSSSFVEKQNIIQYFYVPINEIFLFLFGVILISLGYKFKLRNDKIIIAIIIIIFIGKIFLYGFYVVKKKKYSTLYFYSYNFGALMLNPLFNLPSFLIGMFFGLINYSIQKGINLYDNDFYQRIFNIDNINLDINNKESILDKKRNNLERRITLNNSQKPIALELNNLDKSKYSNNEQNCNTRSYSQIFMKEKNSENNDKLNKKNPKKNFLVKSNIHENGSDIGSKMSFYSNKKTDYNEKIKEMPFLILPIKFLKFHKINEARFYFKLIIAFSIILITFFSCVQFIYVRKHSILEENDDIKTIMEKLSFRNVITNHFLNFIYVIDTDIVVFMVNWVFYIIYSKGSKTGDIYNFFDNNFWSFFLKCYYSFIIISTPIILIIMYQSETVIKFNILNLILFSFISLFITFLGVILFYSMFEIPFKKIFKSFLVKEEILSDIDIIEDDDISNNSDFDLSY